MQTGIYTTISEIAYEPFASWRKFGESMINAQLELTSSMIGLAAHNSGKVVRAASARTRTAKHAASARHQNHAKGARAERHAPPSKTRSQAPR